MGLETVYFISNLGSFVFVLAFKILLFIIYVVLVPFQSCSECLRKRINKLGKQMFWNSWINVISESFMIITLCGVIAFEYNFEFTTWGQTFQTVTSLCVMAIYVLLPLYVYFKSMKEFKALKSKQM